MPKISHQIKILLFKDIQLEWRNKYAFNGIVLYLIGAVFICYLSFSVKRGIIHPVTWNALFWIIILFCSINAIAKSFIGEREGRNLYYYSLVSPQAIIISKIIYNILLLLVLGVLGFVFYSIVMGNPVEDNFLFIVCLIISAIGFASVLTLMSAIASKSSANGTLMAILSFPVILPMLLLVIKVSKNAIDDLDRSVSYDELLIMVAINAIVATTSYVLFPYLWRS